MGDNAAGSDVDYDGWAQEVSEKKSIAKCPRNCSCDILEKNVASFCPCPKISV